MDNKRGPGSPENPAPDFSENNWAEPNTQNPAPTNNPMCGAEPQDEP